MFAPIPVEPEIVKYESGFTEDQEHEIVLKHSLISKRNLTEEPITLEEFRDVIVPYFRVKRTEAFNLNVGKEKVKKERVVKEKVVKEKVVKEKKLTKKEIEKQIMSLAFKKARGEDLTETEQEFFDKHVVKEELI